MIRSIQNRIVFLIAMIGVSMMAGTLISRQVDNQRIESLLERKKHESSVFLKNFVAFKSESLYNFAYDYTFWDDMVKYVKDPDPAWARDNIQISLETFQVKYAWVFDQDLKLIYPKPEVDRVKSMNFPLTLAEMQALVSSGHLYEFYVWCPEGLMQISGGSIHPSSDADRKTPGQGYFFIAREWDSNYVEAIEIFTNTELQVSTPPHKLVPKDSILPDTYGYVNYLSLPGWNKDSVAYLSSAGTMEIARDFGKRSQLNLMVLIFTLFLALTVVSYFLILFINRPLRSLIASLRSEDSAPISLLIRQKSEFGHIARLMNDFFIQKQKLVVEIDERKRVEAELIQAKDKAEESDRLKTAFLNNLSHEIRTPMNAIVGFADLISDERITEQERTEFIGIISESSYRLLGIMTDLINISAIDTGQVAVALEKINLNNMLQSMAVQISQEIDPQKVILNLDVALKDDHSQLLTDRSKLHQIVLNLLKNSAKFTPSGRIDFGYSIRQGEIEFFVRDTGVGIPPDKFETIFGRFRQADDSLSRPYGGTGLGLPISRAYVELMGGRIWLKSEVGQGSEFFFTIPFNTPQ